MIRSTVRACRDLAFQFTMVVAAGMALAAGSATAQDGSVNGMRPTEVRTHAIVGATVVVRPGEVIEDATIVMRRGVIVGVGASVDPPADARIWSGEGMTVYAGFIDPSVLVSVDATFDSVGAHWNSRVHPQLHMLTAETPSSSIREQLRGLGYTAGAFYPSSGIFRGTGSVFALGDDDRDVNAYLERANMMMGFDAGGGFRSGGYPASLMGSIALIRQTFNDAHWHAQSTDVYSADAEGLEPPLRADALAALRDVIEGRQQILFETTDEKMALRASRIADEFDLDMALLGNGYEFRRLDAISALGVPVIVPVNFPKAPNVSTVHGADSVTLRDMQTWEQAPTNLRRLKEAGVDIAVTTHRLRSRSALHGALRSAIKHGLAENDALAAMTTTPAAMLGLSDVMGTVEVGKVANLVVIEGDLFSKEAKIRDTWVDGRRYEISSEEDITLESRGTLVTDRGDRFDVSIDTTKSKVTFHIPADADDESSKPSKLSAKKVIVQRDQVSWVIDGEPFESVGYVRFSGAMLDGGLIGAAVLADGTRFNFGFEPLTDEELEALEEAEAEESENNAAAGDGGGDDQQDARSNPVDGLWTLTLDIPDAPQPIVISLDLELNEDGSVSGAMDMMGQTMDMDGGTYDQGSNRIRFEREMNGTISVLEGTIEGASISGVAQQGEMRTTFSGTRAGGEAPAAANDEDDDDDSSFVLPPNEFVTPLGAYGRSSMPEMENVLVRNATIWTSGPDGIINNGDLLVRDGKIEYVGASRDWRDLNGVRVINAAGRHVTPGLIDCHSHTGINGGINEWTEINTAEVRIGDIVDSDDIDWYRQLAGGLTAANQLHGSANPIGGQNSVVKLKWGHPADAFRVDNAIGGIKFALGENVVRSEDRYPNTRMGVEAVYLDAFTTAREYEAKWKRYEALSDAERSRTMPPRRDLELETLVEILNGERLIHCHSYRQDEILMLIRVADHFGFTIGTFQHILEGYKVADEIARHGAGGSSFSDWWAYKVEVMDAIPYNGALMTQVGVLMSFNSDSDELARRMNLEAAKAVRYGGLEPAEALKLVTINPAKQLRIGDRTGSLEVGKDADFVIWSTSPLSNYTRCQQTWIEGACYYSIEDHQKMTAANEVERRRLIQKILTDAHGEAPSAAVEDEEDESIAAALGRPVPRAYRWMIEDARAWMEEQVRLGANPEEVRPGDCGCNDYIFYLMESMERNQ